MDSWGALARSVVEYQGFLAVFVALPFLISRRGSEVPNGAPCLEAVARGKCDEAPLADASGIATAPLANASRQ
jgi:hypothetical protein